MALHKKILFSPSIPLVLTRKSGDSRSAFRRYLETFYYISVWYSTKPWEDVSSWTRVNGMHLAAAKTMRNMTREEREKKAKEVSHDCVNRKKKRKFLSQKQHVFANINCLGTETRNDDKLKVLLIVEPSQ